MIACEPPHLLSYTWTGGAETNTSYGSVLNSTVTWTLASIAGGTRLRMEHAGFVSPDNDFAYTAMNSGWSRIVERLEAVVAEQPACSMRSRVPPVTDASVHVTVELRMEP